MYRKKSSLILFVSVLLFAGFTPGVFAIDFSNTLKQSAQDTTTAASLFAGKVQVGNLYSQALKIVKQNETAATDAAVNSVLAYYAALPCTITAQDVLHILYISNLWFRTFFDQQVLSSLSSSWSLPTPAAINASYAKFFACEKRTQPVADDFVRVQKNLITLYYQSLNSNFYSSTLAQDNVGEDLFRNGNPDDSDFDLLVDINTLGDIMFTSFKKAPEIAFYRLPSAGNNWWANWWANWWNNWWTNWWSNWWNNSGTNWPGTWGITLTNWTASSWIRGAWVPPSPVPLWTKPASSSLASVSPATVSSDVDVQQFLTTNNPSTFVQPEYSFLVGNACSDSNKVIPSQAAVQETTEDLQTYISGLTTFIDNANTDEVVQAALLSQFDIDYAKTQESNPTQTAAAIANDYAEIAFGEWTIWDGTCESACVPLTGTDQIQCQLGCAKSCIQNCADLPLDDKLLCVTDCSCKMISGPKWAWWDKVEDMFSIKFCKQPVKQVATPAKQNVSNLEGILTALSDVLQWLKSSGQTIKMKKTKEFLDLGITLNMADLLDFKIFFAFKPIFSQKADAAQKRKQILDNETLAKATKWASNSATSENYNKYIVIADVAKNKALQQPVADVTAEKTFQTIQQVADASLSNPIKLYQQQKSAFLAEDILLFLQSHMAFWDHFFAVSTDMLLWANTLKKNIENSK
jgi:hypothetical protein